MGYCGYSRLGWSLTSAVGGKAQCCTSVRACAVVCACLRMASDTGGLGKCEYSEYPYNVRVLGVPLFALRLSSDKRGLGKCEYSGYPGSTLVSTQASQASASARSAECAMCTRSTACERPVRVLRSRGVRTQGTPFVACSTASARRSPFRCSRSTTRRSAGLLPLEYPLSTPRAPH